MTGDRTSDDRDDRGAAGPGGLEIDDEMLDLYALGALDDDESALVAAAVASDAVSARRVAQTQEALAILGSSSAVEPPASMRAAVLGALDGVPQQQAGAPTSTDDPGPVTPRPVDELAVRRERRAPAHEAGSAAPSRRSALRLAAAAAAVGVVGTGGWTLWRSLGQDEVSVASVADRVSTASDVRVIPASGASGAWERSELRYSPSVGEAVITASEPLPAEQGVVYQMWRIAEEGSDPVPAGELDGADGGVLLGGPEGASVVAVSRESASGATTPTMPLLATYALST